MNSAVISGRELIVVRVVGLPAVHGAGHCFPAVDDATITTFDEVELVYPDRLEKPDRQWVMSTNNGRALATTHLTAGGDCGVVYIGRIGGSWFARAIHYGLMDLLGSKNSVGEMLTQTALKTATARAGVIFQAARHIGSLFTKEETPFFAPLPLKSEARLAKSRGAALHVVGELHPRPFGSTPKTNVKSTIVAEFFRDLEKEWCGEEGYWRPPIFRGAMIND